MGISKNQYSLLEEAGVLKETKPKARGALVDGEHSQHALEKLIKRVASRACVFEGETVEIREINLRFTTDKTGLIAFYETVVSGELSPTTGSTSGKFSEFAFSKEKVHHFLNQRRRSGGWTVQELARITGWKEQCIAHWCDAGLIKHELRSHSRGVARAIYLKALAEFQKKYVQVSSLAKRLDTPSRLLVMKLDERGIETAGAFQDGTATRGLLVALSDLARKFEKPLITSVLGKSK